MYSGVIDFFSDTAGLSGSAGAVGRLAGDAGERGVHLVDQAGNVAGRHRIVADIGGDDFRRQLDEIAGLSVIEDHLLHAGRPPGRLGAPLTSGDLR